MQPQPFRDAECPFGYLSTKHLALDGEEIDLVQAARSNRARAHMLGKFAGYVVSEPRGLTNIAGFNFDDVALRSHVINPHAPSDRFMIFPIPVDRSIEESWCRVAETGSKLTGLLAMRHAEKYNKSPKHPAAARAVMREMSHGRICSIAKYLKDRAAFEFQDMTFFDEDVMPIGRRDAAAIKAYALIQERGQTAQEIVQLNGLLNNRPEIIASILLLQAALCQLLKEFMLLDQAHQDGGMAFSEIAFPDEDWRHPLPSSRFLKVMLHNVGPWMLEFGDAPVQKLLALSMEKARKNGAFEQVIPVFRKKGDHFLLKGFELKVCPAANALVRMATHIMKRD